MSLAYLLADVLCKTFIKNCGKWQENLAQKRAMKFSFSIPIDTSVEDGYRHLDLVLYAPANYVAVFSRERWDVISLDNLEEDEVGETWVQAEKDYEEGASPWQLMIYHDSCWREAVQNFVRQNANKLNTFYSTSIDSFYQLIDGKDFDGLLKSK